jgi:hypothetical protein
MSGTPEKFVPTVYFAGGTPIQDGYPTRHTPLEHRYQSIKTDGLNWQLPPPQSKSQVSDVFEAVFVVPYLSVENTHANVRWSSAAKYRQSKTGQALWFVVDSI